MSGKAIFFVVMGFSLLFMIAGQFYNSVSGRMTDNYIEYYDQTTAHNIAVSGANMAANELFLDSDWNAGYNNIDYQNGKLFVQVFETDPSKHIKQIHSVGIFNKDTSRVKVTLSPSKFSRFAYYSVSEGSSDIWWINQDTVWGPFHTEDKLKVSKHPSFMMSASTKNGLKYYTNEKTDKPYVHGKFQTGVSVPMPTNGVASLVTPAKNEGGLYLNGKEKITIINPGGKNQEIVLNNVHMEFQGEYLVYKYGYEYSYKSGGKTITEYVYTDTTRVYLPDATTNGVILMDNGNIHMKGTVSGQYTIGCSGTGYGKVYLDDDIIYQNDPKTNPNSPDLLGIVAKNGVIVTENTANNSDININASIYVESGGFGAENYKGRPVSGKINLLGGIIQNERGAVGTFDSKTGKITAGFSKQYRYDERLLVTYPPYFPGTGGYEIVSWYE